MHQQRISFQCEIECAPITCAKQTLVGAEVHVLKISVASFGVFFRRRFGSRLVGRRWSRTLDAL